jgi:hypothetical protein
MEANGVRTGSLGTSPYAPRRCESILDRLTWEGEAPAEPKVVSTCGRAARKEARPPELLHTFALQRRIDARR